MGAIGMGGRRGAKLQACKLAALGFTLFSNLFPSPPPLLLPFLLPLPPSLRENYLGYAQLGQKIRE